MQMTRTHSQPSARGPAEWFTGTVRVGAPFRRTTPARIGPRDSHPRLLPGSAQ
jgi:hypothetical protein